MPPINLRNSTTTYSSVNASTNVQTLVVENGSRVGLMIFNASTANLYLRIDADASTSDYFVKLPSNALYEMPRNYFTDKVTGIWDAVDGSAKITEISTKSFQSDN